MKPDRVIVGTDNIRTAKLLEALYAPFARSRDKLMIMGVKSAELTKYAANCLLASKISFINEIANICERVGADVKDVRLGIGSDHRIGYRFIYPGVGYGAILFPQGCQSPYRHGPERRLPTRADPGHRQGQPLPEAIAVPQSSGLFCRAGQRGRPDTGPVGAGLQGQHGRYPGGAGPGRHRRVDGGRPCASRPTTPSPGPMRPGPFPAMMGCASWTSSTTPWRGPMPWAVVTDWNQFRNSGLRSYQSHAASAHPFRWPQPFFGRLGDLPGLRLFQHRASPRSDSSTVNQGLAPFSRTDSPLPAELFSFAAGQAAWPFFIGVFIVGLAPYRIRMIAREAK